MVLSRVMYLMSPSLSTYPVSRRSVRLAAKTMKMAKSYFGDINSDIAGKPCNLSCTLEKLYAWEKKLYKEVKVQLYELNLYWLSKNFDFVTSYILEF